MKADKKNTVMRFAIIIALMVLVGTYIMGTALKTMLTQRNYWEEVSKKFVRENLELPAARGNIYDAEGNLLAGSMPEFWLYMDYEVMDKDSLARTKAQHWRDSVFTEKLDSICMGLAEIFPDKTEAWFRQRLLEGKKTKRGRHCWRIYPYNATYIQYKECQKLPLFREPTFKGGFSGKKVMQRKHPYGTLAKSLLGDLYRDTDAAKGGLEMSFDSILRGTPGVSHRMKVRNRRISFVDQEPIDGHDLITTLDISMQDAAEKALEKMLKDIGAETGVCVLMEVATGDIKAMVNLHNIGNDVFVEDYNHAVMDLWEPGSTFKTGSIMVALEDGKIDTNYRVDCTGGVQMLRGRPMRDHNWRRGGYKVLSVPEILMYSSNLGVSKIIDQFYYDNPEAYVSGLNREGVGIPLDLPLPGAQNPRVRHPKKDARGKQWANWSKTALPWMSIGYETMLPPIATLTYYNAIANGGKMVKPRFVKAEMKDGMVIREFPTEVMKTQICSPTTLAKIQACLHRVVRDGLGRKAGNGEKYFPVSGKTGTAQIAAGKAGYHSGPPRYMVSFCGYYPSNAPKYSCIVNIVKTGSASGGGHCGPVFRDLSLFVMAKGDLLPIEETRDSTIVFTPNVKKTQKANPEQKTVPDVTDMGARSAIQLLQEYGMKVKIHGTGRVVAQSIEAGTKIEVGKEITLTLK